MNSLKRRLLEVTEKDLQEIEKALDDNLSPYLDIVRQAAQHILFSGGKRLRPLLTVLSARICGNNDKKIITFSIIFEYLHAATLLHDDLVDEAAIRRGNPVAHSIWGNAIAVLVGDFLLSRALYIGTETKQLEVIKSITKVTENMCQGEIHQLMKKKSMDLSESEYMQVIRNKTAGLIQGACHVGALLANAGKKEESCLSAYGYNLGIAFQVKDDLLDYTADSQVLGKTVGADLREGKLTLPLIEALKQATPEDRKQMEKIIANKDFSVNEFETLVDFMKRYGGLAYAEKLASEYINKAKEALSIFESSTTKETLFLLADYVMAREV